MSGTSPERGDAAYDAIFVGSGINSLVGAALLAKGGWKVLVLERCEWLGGAIRTVTSPHGYVTELMSCFHAQFIGSPAYGELREELERHGLSYVNTDKPLGVVDDNNRSLILTTDQATNEARLDSLEPGLGAVWRNEVAAFHRNIGDLLGVRTRTLWSFEGARWAMSVYRRRGRVGGLALLADMLKRARTWLTDTFSHPLMHAMLAPWSLHGGSGPDEPGSAVLVRAVGVLSQLAGSPVPVGGGRALVAALVATIESRGGKCLTDIDVEEVIVRRRRACAVRAGGQIWSARRAVVCCVTPAQLYGRLLPEGTVPPAIRDHAATVRPGLGTFQVTFSLTHPLRWSADDDLHDVATVNITGGMDAVSRAVNEGRRGLLPAEPTLCCGQPMALDPTRGPPGTSQLWVQLLEMPPVPHGDALGEIEVTDGWTESVREAYADRIQRRLARHLNGLEEAVVERFAMSPADFERANINLIGGCSSSGAAELDQLLLLRPSPYAVSPRTPVARLYHIGASTHPGSGLSGLSGFMVAKLLQRFWTKLAG